MPTAFPGKRLITVAVPVDMAERIGGRWESVSGQVDGDNFMLVLVCVRPGRHDRSPEKMRSDEFVVDAMLALVRNDIKGMFAEMRGKGGYGGGDTYVVRDL